MKKRLAGLGLIILVFMTGCGNNKELKDKVEPIADAMCRYIEVENQRQAAMTAGDAFRIDSLETVRDQLQMEMTVLNEEFQEKFGDRNDDEKFLRKYKKLMNEALLACPHLSKQDRERLQKSAEE